MSGIVLAEALFDNVAEAADELSFRRGDIVTVLEKDYDGVNGWWHCQLYGRRGIVPFNYVQELTEEQMQMRFPFPSSPHPVDPEAPNVERPYDVPRPSMTTSEGQRILHQVSQVLEMCSQKSNALAVHGDSNWLDTANLPKAVEQLGGAGREAQVVLHDLVRLSLDVLRVTRQMQQSGQMPHLCQQLARPIMLIKNSYEELGRLVDELQRGTDIPSVRLTLQRLRHLLAALQVPVNELTGHVLSNCDVLFIPDTAGGQPIVEPSYDVPSQSLGISTPSASTSTTHIDEDHTPLARQNIPTLSQQLAGYQGLADSQTPQQRPPLVKRPSQIAESNVAVRPLPPAPIDNNARTDGGSTHSKGGLRGRTTSIDSSSSDSSSSRSSSSGDLSPNGTGTLKPKPICDKTDRPTGTLARLNITMGQLTESELSLLAYYAEHMDTLIPNVTNAVEAFCRAISEKQVPKQFVWHSKMVVVGAYKMVYVADTVFQKLVHAELRNHVVACSNRLVDCIKSIVASTKNAAQQYPSVSAMRDMVESVSHLPPLALELAESIKEAAHLH